jgi:hypothetical protein
MLHSQGPNRFERHSARLVVNRRCAVKIHRYLRPALLAVLVLGLTGLCSAQFGVSLSVGVAPPPLPVYDQPPVPESGYIWTPGYWAWGDEGYYWVPGTWVQPPQEGMVWTPGYWGWNDQDDAYGWNDGYWGNEVGYYGGVDYGYGYPGEGYYGGRWQGNQFYYNQAVNNVRGGNIHTVYDNPVPRSRSAEHVSYSGGQGGVQARPTQAQIQARSAHHVEATPAQRQQVQAAKSNPKMFARNNQGKPAIAATAKPGDMSHGVSAKAAGGRVDPKVLSANAKNTPKPTPKNGGRNAAPGGNEANRTAGGNARPNEGRNAAPPANAGERNVPKPPSATPKEERPSNARSAEPRPGANSGAERGSNARATEPRPAEPPANARHEGNAAGMPQSEGASHHAAEPAPRSAEPARHAEQPAGHAAEPPRSAPEKSNKPAEHSNDKPQNEHEKPQ